MRWRRGSGRVRIPLVLVTALGAAWGSGCASGSRPQPASVPVPAAHRDVSPTALLAGLTRVADARSSLRAIARLGIDGPAGAGRVKQLMLVERPARLRVEILGLLDQRLAVLTTDGIEYRLFRAEGRSLTGGPVHAALLWEVAGLAVTPEQAVRLLLAAPALPPQARLVGGTQAVDGRVQLEFRAPERDDSVRVDFDPSGRLAGWTRFGVESGPLQHARWSDYRTLGDEEFPFLLELEDLRTGAQARVQFQSVELNPVLPPELFELRLGGDG